MTALPPPPLPRCAWLPADKPDYIAYHDTEWCVPVHEEHKLFELLILEGAQAGLSWYSILKRREGYRAAFAQFDPDQCAALSDERLEYILLNENVIRHRKKIFSVRENAKIFLRIQAEHGSFLAYLHHFAGPPPAVNRPRLLSDMPVSTLASEALAKDLKRRGMAFVGPAIMYAYMQATGLVNDHMHDCFLAPPLSNGTSVA